MYSGFIQTPGIDVGHNYPPLMDSTLKVKVPPGHVTLVSFRKMATHVAARGATEECDFQADNVEFYTKEDNSSGRSLVWVTCHATVPEPEVHSARVFWVRFVSGKMSELEGFRLLYSFHNEFRAPSRVPGGLWNCSVPEWPHFERHFLCNLKRECEGGEDEVTCPYFGFCAESGS
ncbi:hypothetical protein ACOMHN_060688 [Nucella lapillus]